MLLNQVEENIMPDVKSIVGVDQNSRRANDDNEDDSEDGSSKGNERDQEEKTWKTSLLNNSSSGLEDTKRQCWTETPKTAPNSSDNVVNSDENNTQEGRQMRQPIKRLK